MLEVCRRVLLSGVMFPQIELNVENPVTATLFNHVVFVKTRPTASTAMLLAPLKVDSVAVLITHLGPLPSACVNESGDFANK